MKKLLALLLLLPLQLHAQTYDAGSLQVMTPDRTATATMGALNAAVSVLARGRHGVGVYISTANLNAVVTPECSPDGSVWFATSFVSTAGAVASTLTFGGGADSQFHGITLLPGCQNARARISTYTSGTSSGRIVATATPGMFVRAIPVGTFTVSGSVTQGSPPWQVQSNSANLATQATAATLLTTTAHDAAFGAAGAADAQVRSIQGIASMVPLQVESAGDALATESTLQSIDGRLTTIASAVFSEDAPAQTGDPGIPALTTRADTPAVGTTSDSDYQVLKTDNVGRLWVNPSGVTSPVSGTVAVNPVSPGTGAANLGKAEDAIVGSGDVGIAALYMREDTPTSTALSSGDYINPKTDSVGRTWADIGGYLGSDASASNGVHTRGAEGTASSATWTSATGLNTTLTVDPTGYTRVFASVLCSGTVSGGQVTWHRNDGTVTGVAIGLRLNSGGSSDRTTSAQTSIFATSCSEQWYFEVDGASTDFRATLSTVITGTGNVTIKLTPVSGNATYVEVGSITTSVTAGTGSAHLGKAEDVGHTTGETGVAMWGVVREASGTQFASADNDYSGITTDRYGVVSTSNRHPNAIRCTVAVSTATTLTAVGGSCAAPGAGLSIYITDISFSASASGIAADAFSTLKYGTGGACGTGTTVFWGALSAAANITIDNRTTPIKIPANNEVCWINSTAGSKFLVIGGFIAP